VCDVVFAPRLASVWSPGEALKLALTRRKATAGLEDSPPDKVNDVWGREQWDKEVGDEGQWSQRLQENDVMLLHMLRLAETELPSGTTLAERLVVLEKLNSVDERAAILREQLHSINEAVSAVEASAQLKRLLATTVECLNFMRSGVKKKSLKASINFQFLIDPGITGLEQVRVFGLDRITASVLCRLVCIGSLNLYWPAAQNGKPTKEAGRRAHAKAYPRRLRLRRSVVL
jgi:hypothetical protein